MRPINSLYTHLRPSTAPFRGRYKGIVVEADSYPLQQSRYIHRNPLEARLVAALVAYQ
ncbi:MAG: hypothetical protein P8Y42_13440 [Exilibacterium sp.]